MHERRAIAATEVVLLVPAVLFLTAVVARDVPMLGSGTTHLAQQVVAWYAGRLWTLWVLLVALPLAALVVGCATLLGSGAEGAPRTGGPAPQGPGAQSRLIVCSTVAAGVILVIVGLHVFAN